MKLTDTKIRNAKPREKVYRLSDGGGLYLEVKPNGSKIFRYRYMLSGRTTTMSLGHYPVVSLIEAREKLRQAKADYLEGADPIKQRQQKRAQEQQEQNNHFGIYAEALYAEVAAKRSVGYAKLIRNNLDLHILPALGNKPVTGIDTVAVVAVLDATMQRIAARGHQKKTGEVQALNVLSLIRRVFERAQRTNHGLQNPALAAKGIIERPPVENARDLTKTELRTLLNRLEGYNGFPSTKGVLWTMLYTMCRTKEARYMQWAHVDLEDARWNIPAAEIHRRKRGERNMKMDRPHIFPLSRQMVDLLRNQQKYTGTLTYVWPSMKHPDQPISITTVNNALELMGMDDVTGHDTRATCSTYLHEMGFDHAHIEMQMAHVDNSVSGGYNHARWLPSRREMLQRWADYLESLKDG